MKTQICCRLRIARTVQPDCRARIEIVLTLAQIREKRRGSFKMMNIEDKEFNGELPPIIDFESYDVVSGLLGVSH